MFSHFHGTNLSKPGPSGYFPGFFFRVLGVGLFESGYPSFWFSMSHQSTINKTLWPSGQGNRQEICFVREHRFKSCRCFLFEFFSSRLGKKPNPGDKLWYGCLYKQATPRTTQRGDVLAKN